MSPRKSLYETAVPYLPSKINLTAMEKAVQSCKGCDLYKNATQAIFGEGPRSATCIMIGEQPGNEEDLQGKPFVGPAGKLLDRALKDAGIDRTKIYVTNAVKHFKNEMRGSRRLHRSPDVAEINACRPWLEQEIKVTRPNVIVCMGKSAARSVIGRSITLRDTRGKFLQTEFSDRTLVTVHPSSILRSPDDESRHQNYAAFLEDLKIVAREI